MQSRGEQSVPPRGSGWVRSQIGRGFTQIITDLN